MPSIYQKLNFYRRHLSSDCYPNKTAVFGLMFCTFSKWKRESQLVHLNTRFLDAKLIRMGQDEPHNLAYRCSSGSLPVLGLIGQITGRHHEK